MEFKADKQPKGITLAPTRGFAITLIWTGILGWFAAFSLVLERIHVATNPEAVLSCDLNPFISCKSVMLTEQARLLGFPNPLIGLAAFIFLLRGQFPHFWAVFRAHMSFYNHLPSSMKERRKWKKLDRNAPISFYKGSILWALYIQKVSKFKDLNQRKFDL